MATSNACWRGTTRIDGAPDDNATLAQLWQLAEENTPHADVATYTQAIMDLGATLCTRGKPRCADCPIAADCRARIEGRQAQLPAAKRKRARAPPRRAVMLVARHDSAVLLVQRPASGIWGGLWCLPEFDDRDAAEQFASQSARARQAGARGAARNRTQLHALRPGDHARSWRAARARAARAAKPAQLWYDLAQPARVGLPAPIKTLLGTLSER